MSFKSVTFKIAAVDPRGFISEEDRKGRNYQTKRYVGINNDLEYINILSYKNHHLLRVGQTIALGNPAFRGDRVIINGNTQIVKGYLKRNVDDSAYTTAEFKVQQPIQPFVPLKDAKEIEIDSVVSLRGVVHNIGEIRRWTADGREKASQDIFISAGEEQFLVTVWNQCTYAPIAVGDSVEFHDVKIKHNQYHDRTAWCSLNDCIWIHKQATGQWKEYEFMGYDDDSSELPNTVKLMLNRGDVIVTATCTHAVLREFLEFSENDKDMFFLDLHGRKVKALITDNSILGIAPPAAEVDKSKTPTKVDQKKRPLSGNSNNPNGEGPSKKKA